MLSGGLPQPFFLTPGPLARSIGQGHVWAPLSGLAQQAIDRLAKLATATCLNIKTFIIHNGPFSPLNTWPLPCNRSTKIPLPSLHTTSMSPFSSPEETFVDCSNGMHNITPAFMVPPSPLLGGGHMPTSGALECQGKTHETDPTPEPTTYGNGLVCSIRTRTKSLLH
jgi:hypothetical protein